MAESICRALRDGSLEGEYAPALSINDSIDTPFGPLIFNYVLTQLSSNILAGKSQSRGLVLVALSRNPSFYADMLKNRGHDMNSSNKWIRILDCYTDPLGWKDRLKECGGITGHRLESSISSSLCKNVSDLNKLFSMILDSGKELVGQGKSHFSVAIDSVSDMLSHASISSVSGFISNLRSHNQVSCLFWSLHPDLHEIRTTAALEYMCSMSANVEPMTRPTDGERSSLEYLYLLEQNSKRGKFNVRFKRRNGRVRVMSEELNVEQSGVKFSPVLSDDSMITQSLVPKVQFNLQLSEKERIDRAKVVLPFEHQENDKSIHIYDGRRSLTENNVEPNAASVERTQTNEGSGKGEIIYFRDSDDEMPDSDEDPDNDLDI